MLLREDTGSYNTIDIKLGLFKVYEREMKLRNYSPKTIKTYTSLVKRFAKHIHPLQPKNASPEQIKDYMFAMINQHGLSHASLDQTINALKFLYEEIYQIKHVMDQVIRPHASKHIPVVLTRDEISTLFSAVNNPTHLLMLQLMYSAGLRVSEVVNLRIRDIQLDNLTIFVRNGKGYRDRVTIYSDHLREYLLKHMDCRKPEGFLFITNRSKPYTTRAVQKIFEKALKKTDIQKKASCRTLRHSFATHLLESGIDIHYVQILMGHASVTTTNIYTKVRNPHLFKIKSPL